MRMLNDELHTLLYGPSAAIRARVAPSDRVDLDLSAREPMREPAQFGRAH